MLAAAVPPTGCALLARAVSAPFFDRHAGHFAFHHTSFVPFLHFFSSQWPHPVAPPHKTGVLCGFDSWHMHARNLDTFGP